MPNYFSKEGLSYFQGKLGELQKKAQGSGKEVGEEAGPNCDWHDNFGFEEARRRLEMDSKRVQELTESLRDVQIVEAVEQSVRVAIGNTVGYLEDDEFEKEVTIGAWGESNPSTGLITYQSPLGKALLGARIGDVKTANLGGKTKNLEVTDIMPPSSKYKDLVKEVFAEKPPAK